MVGAWPAGPERRGGPGGASFTAALGLGDEVALGKASRGPNPDCAKETRDCVESACGAIHAFLACMHLNN